MFTGKSIIITGASSGLGKSLSLEFARKGAKLALFDKDLEKLKETGKQCRELGSETLTDGGDVTRPEDCEKFVKKAGAKFGSLDYVVACAGISMWAKFEDIKDVNIYRKMMDINYLGVVHCLYYALPMLKVNKGMMVVISSIQGKIGVPYHTGYVASKFALQGFFQSLRMELDGSGVDILMVLPHWIRGTNLRSNAFGKDGSTLGDSRQKHTGESITVEECCRKIIKAMQKRKKELVIPPKLKLLPWLNMISPGLLEWIINKKTGEQGK